MSLQLFHEFFMIIYEELSESSNIMQILGVLSSMLVTQSKGQPYFSVIFLLASDHSFIQSLIMSEFLIYARPLITAINKYRLNLFKMVKRPMHFLSLWVQCVFTLGRENYCVQIYLCHLGCILESTRKLLKNTDAQPPLQFFCSLCLVLSIGQF